MRLLQVSAWIILLSLSACAAWQPSREAMPATRADAPSSEAGRKPDAADLLTRVSEAVKEAHSRVRVGERPRLRVRQAALDLLRGQPLDVIKHGTGTRCYRSTSGPYRGLLKMDVDCGDPIDHLHLVEGDGVIVDVRVSESPVCWY